MCGVLGAPGAPFSKVRHSTVRARVMIAIRSGMSIGRLILLILFLPIICIVAVFALQVAIQLLAVLGMWISQLFAH